MMHNAITEPRDIQAINDLLAVLLRDNGERLKEVGYFRACQEALVNYYALRTLLDEV